MRFSILVGSASAVLALLGCSSTPGGQTGSELVCGSDADCVSALGPGYRCGPASLCIEVGDGGDVARDGGGADGAVDAGRSGDGGSGGDGGPISCRTTAECPSELECAGPNEPIVCGVPPREECVTDGDCGGVLVCHSVVDPCSSDGIGSACMPACTVDADCDDGLRCNAGACEAIPCDQGWSCAAIEMCDPASIGTEASERNHGCIAMSCTTDLECSSSHACVSSRCQEGLGTCVTPTVAP
jgi:hypothetical protein